MPELGIGILVEAHLLAQALGIEAPALAIGAVAAEAAELRTSGSSCASAIWK
jgi:hypothetical protein